MLEQIDHVNLVVRDIEPMVRFYCQVLGLRQTKRVTIGGPWVEQVVNLPRVEALVVYLEPQQGPRVELIQYVHPVGNHPQGLDIPNTMGLRHLAFRVTDIDRALEALKQAGVKPHGPIAQVPDSQVKYAGGIRKRLLYFHDPEQNLLELCEYR